MKKQVVIFNNHNYIMTAIDCVFLTATHLFTHHTSFSLPTRSFETVVVDTAYSRDVT